MSYSDKQAPTKATPLNEAVSNVVCDIQSGVVPTTAEVTRVFDEAGNLIEAKKREAPLTPKGENIATQVKEVISSAKQLVEEKNAGDSVQKIVMSAQGFARETTQSKAVAEARNIVDETSDRAVYIAAKQGVNLAQTANAVLKLSVQVVASREFRLMLVELLDLLQEGLQTATNKLQQGAESLQESVERLKSEVGSEEPAKEQAKRLAEEGGKKLGEKLGEGAAKAIDVGASVKEKITDIREGRMSPGDLVPLSEERKEAFRQRFNALLDKLSQDTQYNEAIRNLFATWDQFRALLSETVEKAKEPIETAKAEIRTSCNLQEMWDEGIRLLGRFCSQETLEVFMQDLRDLTEFVTNNQEIQAWWYDLRSYIMFTMDHPREAVSSERTKQLNSLIDRAYNYALDVRYGRQTRRLVRHARQLLDEIRNDSTTNKFIDSLRNLARTLFVDRKGNYVYKPEELRQLRILLTSIFMEEFKYLPVGRLSGSTDTYDFLLQNVVLYGYDLLPDHVLVKFESAVDMNLPAAETQARSNLTIRITHIKTHMKNVNFWIRRRGFISFEDHGIADISIGGNGTQLILALELNSTDGIVLKKVTCDIDQMNLHVSDSRYDFLINLFSGFFSNSIRRSIEREVEARVTKLANEIFSNLREVTDQLPSFGSVASVVKENVKDIQATKKRLEVDSNVNTQVIH